MSHSFTTAGVCVFCGCSPATAAELGQPRCVLADRHLDPAAADALEAADGPALAAGRAFLRAAVEGDGA